ncbi:hypothetical protein DL93DRAFT_1320753 [Clavulina sp. PMI_390]|nr:hypothetical protein DL93DRAFT_1320753 [Clavulina sp. PMI_390]
MHRACEMRCIRWVSERVGGLRGIRARRHGMNGRERWNEWQGTQEGDEQWSIIWVMLGPAALSRARQKNSGAKQSCKRGCSGFRHQVFESVAQITGKNVSQIRSRTASDRMAAMAMRLSGRPVSFCRSDNGDRSNGVREKCRERMSKQGTHGGMPGTTRRMVGGRGTARHGKRA